MTVQDALTGFRLTIEEVRQVQGEAEQARENIRAHFTGEADALAEVAARLAATTHSGLEQSAAVLDALVRENAQLSRELENLKSCLTVSSPATTDDEDDAADDHFFGTHLREAWSLLRHK